jgi:hypothetical protein
MLFVVLFGPVPWQAVFMLAHKGGGHACGVVLACGIYVVWVNAICCSLQSCTMASGIHACTQRWGACVLCGACVWNLCCMDECFLLFSSVLHHGKQYSCLHTKVGGMCVVWCLRVEFVLCG